MEGVYEHKSHDEHGDEYACMETRSLFSGMPREQRERARLIVFRAWFDDSGKDAPQSPVYVLAGFSAHINVWNDFADDWQAELNQTPRLRYLKASDAYNFQNQFGFDKETQQPSEWRQFHGKQNVTARDERLSKFVKIIAKHLAPDPIEPYGLTWMLSHKEYEANLQRMKSVKTATIKDLQEIERHIRNPYYLSFQRILRDELLLRAAQNMYRGTSEKTEILFDEGIDNPANLEKAFGEFIEVVRLNDPDWLDFLQNKTPEYRDDKCNPPLQAADLLAWHIRKMCLEISRGATSYSDPVWLELHENSGIKYYDYRYEAKDWDRILTRVRLNMLRTLGIWIPPERN